MSNSATTAELEQWVRTFARLIQENKDNLTDLDAAIGDADHGANMDRGLKAAVAALDENAPPNPSALFTKVGMTLVSTVGGASGPLYGTLFLRLGGALPDTEPVSSEQLAVAMRAGLDGVVTRGKAEAGDKTMSDALAPAVDAMEAGRDSTTPMLARKGRASYLGERSVGHQDPGATSATLLIAAADEVF